MKNLAESASCNNPALASKLSSEEQMIVSSSSLHSLALEVDLLSSGSPPSIVCTSGLGTCLHVSDVMLYRMFIEDVVGLQSGNECSCNNIVATIINHSHPILKITDIAFECLSWLHFDGRRWLLFFLDSYHEAY